MVTSKLALEAIAIGPITEWAVRLTIRCSDVQWDEVVGISVAELLTCLE